jgi:chromate transport protein ChrA
MGGRVAFILPNFLIVAALGALYVHFGGLKPVTAIFYGVSPAVIALILHSCYRLARFSGPFGTHLYLTVQVLQIASRL